MESNEHKVNPKLMFCLHKFRNVISYTAMTMFISDPDVERYLLMAVNSNVTIEEHYINLLSHLIFIQRYVIGEGDHYNAWVIYKKTSKHLGIANDDDLSSEIERLKAIKKRAKENIGGRE